MDLASTRNPVHGTADPVFPCSGIHILEQTPEGAWHVAFTLPNGLVFSLGWVAVVPCTHPCNSASSIDSLVRVTRRAESGTVNRISGQAQLPSAPGPRWGVGGPAGRPPSEWCSHPRSRRTPEPHCGGGHGDWPCPGTQPGFRLSALPSLCSTTVSEDLLRSSRAGAPRGGSASAPRS